MENEGKTHRSALLWSVLFHAAVIALFLFLNLHPPYPLPEEVVVEVAMGDLGSTLDGAGNVTPDNIALPTSDATQPNEFNAQPVTPTTDSPRQFVTDDNSDAAVASSPNQVKETRDTDNPTTDRVKPEPRQVNTRALYAGSRESESGDSQGGSEGSGEGLGDRGNPNGTPGGRGILGNGSGTWELNGRSLVRDYRIPTTTEEGTVVVKIWVDRRGSVFRAQAIMQGTTTASEKLRKMAEEAAMKFKFDEKGEAPPEQVGKFTFVFILR